MSGSPSSPPAAPVSTDEVITKKVLRPRLVVTRRVDQDFGKGEPAPPLSVAELERQTTPSAPSGGRSGVRNRSTAKWPPATNGGTLRPIERRRSARPPAGAPPSSGRGREHRPRLSGSMSAWAHQVPTSDESLLTESVRALSVAEATPSWRHGPAIDQLDEELPEDPGELLAALGGPDRVPCARIPSHEIRTACDDPREVFLLSLLDGMSTTAEVVEASGLKEPVALQVLLHLLDRELVAFDEP